MNYKSPSKEGFSFNGLNLVLGVALFFWLSEGSSFFSDDWTIYLYLAVVVIIHELGHVVMGKTFGCMIREMQVFFLSFISYKPKQQPGGSSWRDIKWSLGVLPLGGFTMFKTREANARNEGSAEDEENGMDGMDGMDGNDDMDGNDSMESIDWEAMGLETEMTSATSPYIEDKSAWQRLLIYAGGVLFNIATFLILYLAMPYMSDGCYDFLWPLVTWSLILAMLNILPVYPLDGGSIVFALYEMVTGKKPSEGFTKACAWIGFILIILFFWVFPEWLGGIIESVFGLFF